MSQGRARHAAAVVGAGLYVCGGEGGGRLRLQSTEVFDTVTNTWQSLPAMVHPRRWSGPRVHGPRELDFFGALASHRKLAGAASNA